MCGLWQLGSWENVTEYKVIQRVWEKLLFSIIQPRKYLVYTHIFSGLWEVVLIKPFISLSLLFNYHVKFDKSMWGSKGVTHRHLFACPRLLQWLSISQQGLEHSLHKAKKNIMFIIPLWNFNFITIIQQHLIFYTLAAYCKCQCHHILIIQSVLQEKELM